MNALAIIPARGGSKRIPRKNIKDFLGKPIIAYSIQAALQSGLFTDVIVSTDDEEIAEVARRFGASVPFMRSKKNSDDTAILSDVIDEIWLFYENKNLKFDLGCCILPTSPLLSQKNLQLGLSCLQNGGFDSIQAVTRFSYPIQRALKLDSNGAVTFFYPEYTKTRSQDLEPAYHDVGQLYWFKWSARFSGKKKGAFEIPESEIQDIDTLEDWKMAELKYQFLFGTSRRKNEHE